MNDLFLSYTLDSVSDIIYVIHVYPSEPIEEEINLDELPDEFFDDRHQY